MWINVKNKEWVYRLIKEKWYKKAREELKLIWITI
jgi:hypothetical protein